MGDATLTIIWLLISLSTVITIIHKTAGISLLKKNPKLDSLFSVKGFWLVTRIIGFVFANMIYFNIGPEYIIGGATGGDDAIAMCISHAFPINIAWVYLVSDALVLGLSLTYIPLQRILWSLLTVVLSGQIIGFVQNFRVKKKKS